jgi:hypothetical protein
MGQPPLHDHRTRDLGNAPQLERALVHRIVFQRLEHEVIFLTVRISIGNEVDKVLTPMSLTCLNGKCAWICEYIGSHFSQKERRLGKPNVVTSQKSNYNQDFNSEGRIYVEGDVWPTFSHRSLDGRNEAIPWNSRP